MFEKCVLHKTVMATSSFPVEARFLCQFILPSFLSIRFNNGAVKQYQFLDDT